MNVLLYSDSRDDGTTTRQSREGCRCTGPGVTGGRVTDSRGSRTSFRAAISFPSYRSRPPAPRYTRCETSHRPPDPQSAYPCVSGRAEKLPRPRHCQQPVDTDPGRVYGIGTAVRVSTHPRIYRCWRRHVCHVRSTRALIRGAELPRTGAEPLPRFDPQPSERPSSCSTIALAGRQTLLHSANGRWSGSLALRMEARSPVIAIPFPPISLLKNLPHRSPPVARPRFQRHGSGKVETVPRRSGAATEADLLQQEGTQSVRPLCRPDVRDRPVLRRRRCRLRSL